MVCGVQERVRARGLLGGHDFPGGVPGALPDARDAEQRAMPHRARARRGTGGRERSELLAARRGERERLRASRGRRVRARREQTPGEQSLSRARVRAAAHRRARAVRAPRHHQRTLRAHQVGSRQRHKHIRVQFLCTRILILWI